MADKKSNPFGLSDIELESEVSIIKDDMLCELESEDCDYSYLMERADELESMGVDIFSLF